MLEELEKVFNEIKKGEEEVELERENINEKRKLVLSLRSEIASRETEISEIDAKLRAFEEQCRVTQSRADFVGLKLSAKGEIESRIKQQATREASEALSRRQKLIAIGKSFGKKVFEDDYDELELWRSRIRQSEQAIEKIRAEKAVAVRKRDESRDQRKLRRAAADREVAALQERANYLAKRLQNARWQRYCRRC